MKHIRNKLPWHHRHQLEETYLKERKEKLNDKNLKKHTEKDLYFHWEFHPNGITRSDIQKNYEKTCNRTDTIKTQENGKETEKIIKSFKDGIENEETGGTFKIKKLTVAYKRPKNLREHLNPTTLKLQPNMSILHYLNTPTD